MRKRYPFFAASVAFLLLFQIGSAQNTSPYWSLAGNSNATTTSKLGTTNGVSLRFYANNVQRMVIAYTTGNLGIGTSTLPSRLTVNAPTGSSVFSGQVNGSTKLFAASNGGLSIGSGSTPPSNGLYVSGRVGIGTTSPAARLHINGTNQYTTALQLNNGGIKVLNDWSTGDSSVGIYSQAGTAIYGSGMIGVLGDGMTGVRGTGYAGVTGESFEGGSYGVSGYSNDGYGIYGYSETGNGVYGSSNSINQYAGVFIGNQYRGLYVQGGKGWYAGYFAGDIYTTGTVFQSSDARLKKNITDLGDAMSLIGKLQPKQYEYRDDGNYAKLNLPKGGHYGLLAQDVEKVLPQLVKDASTNTRVMAPGQKADISAEAMQRKKTVIGDVLEHKGVNYTELIPIVIKGMQEQQAQIQQQAALLKEQQQQIEDLKNLVNRLTGAATVTSATLGQNTPNPAKSITRINVNLPTGTRQAQLLLTDAAGKTVKTLSVNASGVVDVNTTALSSGMYTYSLVVDGKIQETKKLLVAH